MMEMWKTSFPTVVASGHGPLLEGNVLGQHDPLKKRVLQTVALVNGFFGGQQKKTCWEKQHVPTALEVRNIYIYTLCVGRSDSFWDFEKMGSQRLQYSDTN